MSNDWIFRHFGILLVHNTLDSVALNPIRVLIIQILKFTEKGIHFIPNIYVYFVSKHLLL